MQSVQFDQMVGKIAGGIYSGINHHFPHPPLLLVPALTFKVRKTMERLPHWNNLSTPEKILLAHDIQRAIVPVLFSYEIDENVIEELTPIIEDAAYKAMN